MHPAEYQKRLLTTKQLAQRINRSESWVEKSRLTGQGPPFIKLKSGCLYDPDDIDQWLEGLKRRSTSQVA
jgi:hypothetical protein